MGEMRIGGRGQIEDGLGHVHPLNHWRDGRILEHIQDFQGVDVTHGVLSMKVLVRLIFEGHGISPTYFKGTHGGVQEGIAHELLVE